MPLTRFADRETRGSMQQAPRGMEPAGKDFFNRDNAAANVSKQSEGESESGAGTSRNVYIIVAVAAAIFFYLKRKKR